MASAMYEKPTHLDLFSGIGGFALAAQRVGFQTVGFCEIDPFCRAVIAARFKMPTHPNIHTLDGAAYADVDLITGGFPCQPYSVAGKRRGAGDDRALWPAMLRVIKAARPRWVLAENVPGIINMALDQTLVDLENEGYATGTMCIPACAVDARHERKRVWILAHTDRDDQIGRCGIVQMGRKWESEEAEANGQPTGIKWAVESRMGGVADGISNWMDKPDHVTLVTENCAFRAERLHALGNAVVPQVVVEILKHVARDVLSTRAR